MMTEYEPRITPIKPFQWRELKTLRLEALRADPAAFSSSYDDTVAYPDEYWRQRLEDRQSVHLMARVGRQPVGMVGAYIGPNDGEHEVAVIFGMYVSQDHRGRGIGRALLEAVIAAIGRSPEIRTIRLWVVPAQAAALALYESLGFRATGDPAADGEIVMERPVRMVSPG